MVVDFIVVGRTAEKYLETGISDYVKRLGFYLRFKMDVVPDIKGAKNMRKDQIKQAEGEAILSKISTSDLVVLLDDKGVQRSSQEMADWIQGVINRGVRRVVFVVGGAYGFSDAVYERAVQKLSLSRMTFSHQMVRLIFVEQLYRSMTILKGEPYHHE